MEILVVAANLELGNVCYYNGVKSSSVFLRADKIDFKNWDVKHLSGTNLFIDSSEAYNYTKTEEWEIDLGKLDIKNVIAYGTYGTVYKAVYDGQDVAVKVLDWGDDGINTAAENAALRTSFQQEVALWYKLDHPNVTKFDGASMGTSNLKIPLQGTLSSSFNMLPSGACCVVVEYIPGGTLKKFLFKNSMKKLAFKVVIQLALDLARGLSYLHAKKIAHCNVQTENMLLDGYRNLKIADFGVARVKAQNPRDKTGNAGTLGYMAPEVINGNPYNRKCDVYTFQCIYLSFVEVSSAVVQKNLRPDIPRCCPSAFASIMGKCWDSKPENRPGMDEVVRLLESVDTSKGGGMIPEDQVHGCFRFSKARGP